MAQAKLLKLRLFLEGLEVPVIAASISSAINSPAVASIQVIPADSILFLKARTVVHLFFDDYLDEESVGDNRFKLLFSGELVSLNFNKDPQTRFVVLQCLDFTNIWDNTYHYYQNFGGDNTNLDGIYGQISGQSASLFNDQVSPLWLIRQSIEDGAKKKELPLSLPGTGGILGGIIHLIDRIGGVAFNNKLVGEAISPFYIGYNLRNRLTDQVFASDQDNTSANLFELSAFAKIVDRDLGQGGFRLSFRQIIDTVLKYVYYSWINVTSPKYDELGRVRGSREAEVKQVEGVKFLKDKIAAIEAGILRIKKGPNEGINTNISALLNFRETRPGEKPPTVEGLDERNINLFARTGTVGGEFSQFVSAENKAAKISTEPFVDHSGSLRDEAIEAFGSALFTGGALFDKGPSGMEAIVGGGKFAEPIASFRDRIKDLEEEIERITVSPQDKKRKFRRSDRLNSIIFRPDVYFLPPPKCNVFFPELYSTFGFSRNILAEPSRLFVDTSHVLARFDTPLLRALKFRVLGPDLPSVSGISSSLADQKLVASDRIKINKTTQAQEKLDREARKRRKRTGEIKPRVGALVDRESAKQSLIILPHEVFTGILPQWATLPDLAVYFARSGERPVALDRKVQREETTAEQREGLTDKEIILVEYLKDATNFEFFKMRFMSRTLNIQGRFNPYVVMGFPALVIDKPLSSKTPTVVLDEDKEASREKPSIVLLPGTASTLRDPKDKILFSDPTIASERFKFGTHYLGMIANLRHALNQEGGFTFVDMTHVRTHNEAVDFEGDLKSVGLEDIIFPTWFSDIFRPREISKFYQDAIGVPSIMEINTRNPIDLDIAPGELGSTSEQLFGINSKIKKKTDELEGFGIEFTKLRRAFVRLDSAPGFTIQTETLSSDRARDPGINYVTSPEMPIDSLRVDPRPNSDDLETLRTYYSGVSTQLKGSAPEYVAHGVPEAVITDASDRAQEAVTNLEKSIILKENIEQANKDLNDLTEEKNKEDPKSGSKSAEDRKLEPGNDMRKAVEALILLYSEMAEADVENEERSRVDTFVNKYIFRKIATLPEILGTPADQFFAGGKNDDILSSFLPEDALLFSAELPGGESIPIRRTGGVLDRLGSERVGGFHSEAFGSLDIPEADQAIEAIDIERSEIKSSDELDPRGPRRSVVRGYLKEIRPGALRG